MIGLKGYKCSSTVAVQQLSSREKLKMEILTAYFIKLIYNGKAISETSDSVKMDRQAVVQNGNNLQKYSVNYRNTIFLLEYSF